MEITIERTVPNRHGSRLHFCLATRELIGLVYTTPAIRALPEVFCPWCGVEAPLRNPDHHYARTVRPEIYDGPLCEHGRPDVPCTQLAESDRSAWLDLRFGAIREFRAAELAKRYGLGPSVIEWVRPCPQCREQFAVKHAASLRHELESIAHALAADRRAAERHVEDLRDDLAWLNDAFAELTEATRLEQEPAEQPGFVYLIGHSRAVKIGWSARHPSRGRLSQLQSGSPDRLALLGLLEGTLSSERRLHERFRHYHLSGEWFYHHEDILTYFKEHGLSI